MTQLIIKRALVKNFKAFRAREFIFNPDTNILVGDNDVGKSTLLEALEIVLQSTLRGKPLSTALGPDLFNQECVEVYLAGPKTEDLLPEILIELFVDGDPDLQGLINSERVSAEGIFMRIAFDPDFSQAYAEFLQQNDPITTLPVEFYSCHWLSFANGRMSRFHVPMSCLFIDPSRMHPAHGRNHYIQTILNSALEKGERSTLNLAYRQLREQFDNVPSVMQINSTLDEDNVVTNKDLSITADVSGNSSWESNLQIALNKVPFQHAGKGEQSQVQIKLGLLNKAEEVNVVMIEEPENHLSHINLTTLLGYIEDHLGSVQLFITTHSSYVLNKLSFDKVCLISEGYQRFADVDSGTITRLKRLPGYDTLRAVLARKVVLVEGPSDELVLKRIYLDAHQILPEANGIDIIVVRGIGFKNYLNILKSLGHSVHILKDNDGSHQTNIVDWFAEFAPIQGLEIYAPVQDVLTSLEPSLINANAESLASLDNFARIALSTRTFNAYNTGTLEERQEYLVGWFSGQGSGGKKVDSAARIFESEDRILYPPHLMEALTFG